MDVDLDHPAIAGYLARLEAAATHLPDWRREELVAEIRSHLNDALLSAADDDDAAVYAAVDRLGDPADIVAAEGGASAPAAPPYGAPTATSVYGAPAYGGPAYGAPPPAPPHGGQPTGWQQPSAPQRGLGAGWGPVELVAVIGLAIGVLTGGIGLLVGIICTWISDRWTTREKVVATGISTLVLLLVVLPVLFLVTVRSGEPTSVVEVGTPATSVVPAPPTSGGTP